MRGLSVCAPSDATGSVCEPGGVDRREVGHVELLVVVPEADAHLRADRELEVNGRAIPRVGHVRQRDELPDRRQAARDSRIDARPAVHERLVRVAVVITEPDVGLRECLHQVHVRRKVVHVLVVVHRPVPVRVRPLRIRRRVGVARLLQRVVGLAAVVRAQVDLHVRRIVHAESPTGVLVVEQAKLLRSRPRPGNRPCRTTA